MKKVVSFLMGFVCIVSMVACSNETPTDTYKVGIIQVVDHPSLNTIRESIVKELEAKGYKEGENLEIIYKNAGGDTATLNTIVNQFRDQKVNVIVAIATPSAQAAARVAVDIPVVFSAVSDPIAAKLVNDLEKPTLNITGTSDEIQVDQIINLALEMYPNTKKIGYLYNSGEINSTANLIKLREYAQSKNLQIIEGPISNTSELQARTQFLMDASDIIFTPNDNSIASSLALVSSLCIENKKPLFVGADSMVNDGGLATIGINYENLGTETADMVIDILNGKQVSDIPVKTFKTDLNTYVNETTAASIGFTDFDKLKQEYPNLVLVK